MTEIRYKNAIVRIHGNPDRKKIEDATIRFLKASAKNKKNRSEK